MVIRVDPNEAFVLPPNRRARMLKTNPQTENLKVGKLREISEESQGRSARG